jgi:hypothetical protein
VLGARVRGEARGAQLRERGVVVLGDDGGVPARRDDRVLGEQEVDLGARALDPARLPGERSPAG